MNDSMAFLAWLAQWEADLPSVDLERIAPEPDRVALLMVDLTRAFARQGPLASPRVAGIVPAAARLARRAYSLGVRHFLLPQDAHSPDALEFSAFPPHAEQNTEASQTVHELQDLPFSDLFTIIPKNSISCDLGTDLGPWLEAHPSVTIFIVTGDCTDICIYQAAMYLRLRANVLELHGVRVVVPADAVQTYDLPVDRAQEMGALPHDGDLLHHVFLYHMALNGVEVVAHIR